MAGALWHGVCRQQRASGRRNNRYAVSSSAILCIARNNNALALARVCIAYRTVMAYAGGALLVAAQAAARTRGENDARAHGGGNAYHYHSAARFTTYRISNSAVTRRVARISRAPRARRGAVADAHAIDGMAARQRSRMRACARRGIKRQQRQPPRTLLYL